VASSPSQCTRRGRSLRGRGSGSRSRCGWHPSRSSRRLLGRRGPRAPAAVPAVHSPKLELYIELSMPGQSTLFIFVVGKDRFRTTLVARRRRPGTMIRSMIARMMDDMKLDRGCGLAHRNGHALHEDRGPSQSTQSAPLLRLGAPSQIVICSHCHSFTH
jgi:hypothetical protein